MEPRTTANKSQIQICVGFLKKKFFFWIKFNAIRVLFVSLTTLMLIVNVHVEKYLENLVVTVTLQCFIKRLQDIKSHLFIFVEHSFTRKSQFVVLYTNDTAEQGKMRLMTSNPWLCYLYQVDKNCDQSMFLKIWCTSLGLWLECKVFHFIVSKGNFVGDVFESVKKYIIHFIS